MNLERNTGKMAHGFGPILYGNIVRTTIASLSTLLLSFLWYMGALKKIEFHEEDIGPFVFIHRIGKGPYKGVGPLFGETIAYMKQTGFVHCNTAGIYYDDPKTTSSPRYSVGFIIEQKDESIFNKRKHEILKGWRVLEVKQTKTVVSYFPMRYMIISSILAVMKTYPAFESQDKYKTHGGIMEIYFKDRIGFYFPQDNSTTFAPAKDHII